MLDLAQIDAIAGRAALATLKKSRFVRAQSAHTTDTDGKDAVMVTIVVHDLQTKPVSGDQALDTMLRVHQELERAGEQRTAIVDFATESEMATGGSA